REDREQTPRRKNVFKNTTKRRVAALGVCLTAAAAGLPLWGSLASADTAGNPSTIQATTATQTNVAPATVALTGLTDSSNVHVVTTATAGTNNGFEIRQCKGGVNITLQAQYVPLQGKNCIDPVTFPPDAGHSYYTTVSSDASLTTATTDFKVA